MTPLRQRMIEDLRIRGLSQSTVNTYIRAVAHFARYFGRFPEVLGREHIRAFQVHLVCKKKLSFSTLNTHTSALRFLYNVTLAKGWEIKMIPRAKTRKRLPRILDSRRMLIYVEQGEGGRDRLVPLAPALLEALREYYRLYRPEEWLFYSQGDRKRHLTKRSIQRTVAKASRAVLGKPISPHTLRHSCATHMLEAGVNICIVQGFLGHQHVATTAHYSHVSREQITATKSPLDLIADAG